MTKIIGALIRHGDYHQLPNTPSAWQPFPLTTTGQNQAILAAQIIHHTLVKQHWNLHTTCDCSQLLRAWQTARIMSDTLNQLNKQDTLHLQSTPHLAERCVGSAANLTINQIEQIIQQDPRFEPLPADWKSNSHFCLPLQGAESLLDAGKRVADHIHQTLWGLKQTATHPTLKLFVGHGAAFRHAAYHLGIITFEKIAQLSMYHCKPIFIALGDDGTWQHSHGDWKIRQAHSQYTD